MKNKLQISIVAPVYNESEGILWFHDKLTDALSKTRDYKFEIVYVNDGSTDDTLDTLSAIQPQTNISVRIIDLSRNFGKEAALSAGIHHAEGSSVITIDSDGQHPVELLPKLIDKWELGADVVIGVRRSNRNEGFVKRYGSKLFYRLFNGVTGERLVPGSTDFRLLDRVVVDEFIKLNERSRITRGLIDWLGFKRDFIEFDAEERKFGSAGYTLKKLFELAINTFVSLSAVPLFIAGYVGLTFILLSTLSALFVFIEQFLLADPLNLQITGSALLGLLTIFLVGIILAAQGLMGVYISRLLGESQGRPLFIVRKSIVKK